MIWINSIPSDRAHLRVEHYPGRQIPRRKVLRYSIPGRSGDVIVPLDAWEPITRSYPVALVPPPSISFESALADAVSWLMQPVQADGFLRLTDSYDPQTFFRASFLGGVDVESFFDCHGHATISFLCDPRRFLRSGETPVCIESSGGVICNPTIYPAKPLILVSGSGAGTITIGDATLSLSYTDELLLDCEAEEASYTQAVSSTPPTASEDDSGITWETDDPSEGSEVSTVTRPDNPNSAVSGTYPTLAAGENTLTMTGGVTSVEIYPRWYVL